MAKKKVSAVYLSWPKPDWTKTVKTNKDFRVQYHCAMLYAHYELSPANLQKEILKYLRTKDPKDPMIERVRAISENRLTTFGKYMYVLNHGGDIPDEIMSKLITSFERSVEEEELKIAEETKFAEYIARQAGKDISGSLTANPVTIQDRLKERAAQISGDIEGWIDDWILDKKIPIKTVEDFFALFKTNDLKSAHTIHIRAAFQKRTKEFETVIDGKDKDLNEGYSGFTKTEMKKLVVMMRNLFLACDMMQEVAKVARVPKAKKPISIEKLISKLKYKKEDTALGIASMNPVNIIGSKEMWVYNTKTRKLGVYRALDANGLTVKGTSILNYSADSVEKTIRKPADVLAEFKKASKVKLRTFLKDLSTVDIPCAGKLNEHHLILRIEK